MLTTMTWSLRVPGAEISLPDEFARDGSELGKNGRARVRINPRQAWVTVIVLASIGFLNYVLLRLYSRRGLYYTAVLGGLVNSTATAAELCGLIDYDEGGSNSRAIGVILLTRIAMFVRNLAILFLLAPRAVATALWPLLVMIAFASLIVWLGRERDSGPTEGLKLPLPVSLGRVLRFGGIFLAIQILSSLAERDLGRYGFLMVSRIGGLVSSASTTASAALRRKPRGALSARSKLPRIGW
jgi:uncharacterized membrane protein (DUF4010 family)